MRYLLAILVVLVLFSGERVYAQRSGPGLFLGTGICSDVTGQVSSQTYCLDYTSGGLYVWNGSQYVPISGVLTASLNGTGGILVTNTNAGTNAQTGFFASNGTCQSGLSTTGTGSTFGLPYSANEGYVNSTCSNGLLVTSSAVLHLAANASAAGTLDVTEDTSGNFSLSNSHAGATIFLNSNNTTGSVAVSGNFSTSGGTAQIASALTLSGTTSVQGTETHLAPLIMTNNQHFTSTLGGGLSPTGAGCGTNAVSIVTGSTDMAGKASVGTSVTGCSDAIIHFGVAFAAAPSCVVMSEGTAGGGVNTMIRILPTTTQLEWASASTDYRNITFDWHCIGIQ